MEDNVNLGREILSLIRKEVGEIPPTPLNQFICFFSLLLKLVCYLRHDKSSMSGYDGKNDLETNRSWKNFPQNCMHKNQPHFLF